MRKRILTISETAEMMGISRSTLCNRITHGRRPRPIFRKNKDGHEKRVFLLADVVDAMDNPNVIDHNPERAAHLEKAAKKKANAKTSYDIQYEVITACCPAKNCGERHKKKVVKGSNPWIYCKKHEIYRSYNPERHATGFDMLYL